MCKSVFANLIVGTLGLAGFAIAPLPSAVAHEGTQMECNETSISAMNADVQSMNDGETKTAAMKEMKLAEEAMADKDMKVCMTHMYNAMEAMEE